MKYKENEKQKLTFVLNYNLSLVCADLFLIDIKSFNSNYLLYIFIHIFISQ